MAPATCEPTPVLPVSRKPPGSVQVPLQNGKVQPWLQVCGWRACAAAQACCAPAFACSLMMGVVRHCLLMLSSQHQLASRAWPPASPQVRHSL